MTDLVGALACQPAELPASLPAPPSPSLPACLLQAMRDGPRTVERAGVMASLDLYLETPSDPGAPLAPRGKLDILLFFKLYTPGPDSGRVEYVGSTFAHKHSKVQVRCVCVSGGGGSWVRWAVLAGGRRRGGHFSGEGEAWSGGHVPTMLCADATGPPPPLLGRSSSLRHGSWQGWATRSRCCYLRRSSLSRR